MVSSLNLEDKVTLLEGVMMRVSLLTVGKTWSRREMGVVDLRHGRFLIFYSSIVAFLSLFLDRYWSRFRNPLVALQTCYYFCI